MPDVIALPPLGKALERARRARRMTVTAAARAAASNRVSWYRVTRGLPCRQDTVLRMAAAVGMTPRRALALSARSNGDQPDGQDLDLSHLAEECIDEIRDRIDLCLEELAHRGGSRAAARPLAKTPTDALRRCVEEQLRELCRRSWQQQHGIVRLPAARPGSVRHGD